MYCQKCGNQVEDNAKFCDACGQPMNTIQTTVQPQMQQTNSQNMPTAASTNYANTSLKCALWGAALSLCCIGLFAQPFALLFGILALKNEEPEKTKAWIGTIIGAIGTVITVFIVYALIVEAGKE